MYFVGKAEFLCKIIFEDVLHLWRITFVVFLTPCFVFCGAHSSEQLAGSERYVYISSYFAMLTGSPDTI